MLNWLLGIIVARIEPTTSAGIAQLGEQQTEVSASQDLLEVPCSIHGSGIFLMVAPTSATRKLHAKLASPRLVQFAFGPAWLTRKLRYHIVENIYAIVYFP